jgi:hypothetical protein
MVGASSVIVAGDDTLTYQSFDDFIINDDGVNLFDMRPETVIESLKLIMAPNDQLGQIAATRDNAAPPQVIVATDPTTGQSFTTHSTMPSVNPDPAGVLKNAYTKIQMRLVPLTGSSFVSDIAVDVSKLQLAKTIDLEAPSNA